MKTKLFLAVSAVAALAVSGVAAAKPTPAQLAAVADKARPEADVQRDAARKPAEMLEFAGVKPGQAVADFIPGGGYFTRIFAKAVGPKGKVYAVINAPPAGAAPPASPPPILAVAADPAYGNIEVVQVPLTEMKLPAQVDLLWTSQNYHDVYVRNPENGRKATKAIYDALKPGGVFVVLDHAAAAGTAPDPQDRLHRIDPALVKKEVEAVGFRFVGESKVLANPDDDHTKAVFDPSIRGHTDQFIYKFQKPR
ncbi:methyltransferase [Phenylobacterium sp.]|uniref:class I SAM-dependent methyltransferase n=1 Tax=Phenylobacterium sp. TaxID=1871053 RepID=UPI0025F84BE4|nr:methyltransferase [Phenylobacterium sp.]MBX3483445.1 class I SAM-dependent methyltransferase [Phenylobacterium sp.]